MPKEYDLLLLKSQRRAEEVLGKITVVHIPVDTRSAFPVISVQSPVSIQYRWQS